MSTPTIQDQAVLTDQAKAWLVALEQALGSGNQPDFDDLLLEESYWRDMVALTWDTCQFWGRDKIRVAIKDIDDRGKLSLTPVLDDAEESASE